ncbi:MAG: hypothetical protein HY231_04485 [Acidobacteria bacterium]|nr:hypothetical protein [Acidobacteriota bacterium]
MIENIETIPLTNKQGLQRSRSSVAMRLLLWIILSISGASYACTTAPSNSNATVSSNTNTSAVLNANSESTMNANATTGVSNAAFATREPEQYSLMMTIAGQGSASNKQGTLAPQTIEFARLGADRRWSLNLPAIGQVVYLEKANMRYLILPSRSQYVEIAPDALGFQLGNVLTPSAIVEHLKPHTQYERLGTETINGRAADKYRFTGAADTHTQAGTVQSESYVYLDEVTGLPLRADVNLAASSGGEARGTIETRDINLNPDAKLFDAPVGYKKVTAEELKQQVQGFIQFIRAFAPMMNQQPNNSAPTPPNTTTPMNANRP